MPIEERVGFPIPCPSCENYRACVEFGDILIKAAHVRNLLEYWRSPIDYTAVDFDRRYFENADPLIESEHWLLRVDHFERTMIVYDKEPC